jgi:hypothetical protein
MTDDSETYQHTVNRWTAGDVRNALSDLPDDTPIIVNIAEEPGGDLSDQQVIIGAGFGRHRLGGDPPDTWRTDSEFALDCEYQSGTYERQRRR